MITLVTVICPHCKEEQDKQVHIGEEAFTKSACVGVRSCKDCGKEFVIYARSTIEVKTRPVVDSVVYNEQ